MAWANPCRGRLNWKRGNTFACFIVYLYTSWDHYNDVMMSVLASPIIGVSIVYSTLCSGVDQRKHQSSASLAFVRGIHRWPSQRANNAKNVSIWWRHHGRRKCLKAFLAEWLRPVAPRYLVPPSVARILNYHNDFIANNFTIKAFELHIFTRNQLILWAAFLHQLC